MIPATVMGRSGGQGVAHLFALFGIPITAMTGAFVGLWAGVLTGAGIALIGVLVYKSRSAR